MANFSLNWATRCQYCWMAGGWNQPPRINCCCMAGSACTQLIIQRAPWTGHRVCASCKKFHPGWLSLGSSYNAVHGMGGI